MRREAGRTRAALSGFTVGAVLAGLALSAQFLLHGAEPGEILGVALLPTDAGEWWTLAALSAAVGAAVGAVGAVAGWLYSRSQRLERGRAGPEHRGP